MRELLFKNLISANRKRKELFMLEHFEEEGVVRELEKRFVYTIKDIFKYRRKKELEAYLNERVEKDSVPQTYIVRSYDSREAREKIIYKITEIQYIVFKDKVVVLQLTQNIKKITSLM